MTSCRTDGGKNLVILGMDTFDLAEDSITFLFFPGTGGSWQLGSGTVGYKFYSAPMLAYEDVVYLYGGIHDSGSYLSGVYQYELLNPGSGWVPSGPSLPAGNIKHSSMVVFNV